VPKLHCFDIKVFQLMHGMNAIKSTTQKFASID